MAGEYFFSFGKLDYVRRDKDGGCILCAIVRRDPAVRNLTVHADDFFSVSINLYPYNPGHLLVFPNEHIGDIRLLDDGRERHLWRLVKHFMDILETTCQAKGFNVGYNMGRVSGASIEHLHLHIVPRYPHEIGFADLIAGKRVLVEDPFATRDRIAEALRQRPFSISMT